MLRYADDARNLKLLDVNFVGEGLGFVGHGAKLMQCRLEQTDSSKAHLFWRERGDNLLKTRIVSEHVPIRVQMQITVAQMTGHACCDR